MRLSGQSPGATKPSSRREKYRNVAQKEGPQKKSEKKKSNRNKTNEVEIIKDETGQAGIGDTRAGTMVVRIIEGSWMLCLLLSANEGLFLSTGGATAGEGLEVHQIPDNHGQGDEGSVRVSESERGGGGPTGCRFIEPTYGGEGQRRERRERQEAEQAEEKEAWDVPIIHLFVLDH
ncbi:hypothetical protein BO71DRAFT_206919 [Aspergillus ellipticus CBS 707.79]|uniref:Uncharacterized protein n=1 Tax=Aspergillus ellipticus CBS 707.79 TaxID=1448320 RepID=A0A319DPS3_9EURO|nr:hypothetical protein BO71DRAFT_206919 [Aspergillus ellipticus CBS 707.79]